MKAARVVWTQPLWAWRGLLKGVRGAVESYLQFVFVVGMRVRQIPKFLSEPEAVFDMLWGYKVLCNFNTTVQIMNLERRNKYQTSAQQPAQGLRL